MCLVPNAPCGVESSSLISLSSPDGVFLMHRVELKGLTLKPSRVRLLRFLMHRVELKEKKLHRTTTLAQRFLMHRVELKGYLH